MKTRLERLLSEKHQQAAVPQQHDANDGDSPPVRVCVHACTSNDFWFATQSGIDKCGRRLADEVESVVEARLAEVRSATDAGNASTPAIVSISFVGHSLGGLISRYAIGELVSRGLVVGSNRDAGGGNSASSSDITGGADGAFALELKTFVSLASPHLGSRRPQRRALGGVVHSLTRVVASRSGTQLLLEDSDAGDEPLLVQLADPAKRYYRGLALFRHRLLCSNACNDLTVGYCTSAISHFNPYAEQQADDSSTHFENPGEGHVLVPHVSHDNKHPVDSRPLPADAFSNDEKGDLLRQLVTQLQQLQWERIDVAFTNSPVVAHDMIACIHDAFTDNAAPVMERVANCFVL